MRLAYYSFRREAWWLLVVSLAIPAIGLLLALVVPAIGRWLGWL